jgi:acid phosphatase
MEDAEADKDVLAVDVQDEALERAASAELQGYNAFAVTHPSQPYYFAQFSGSTQGICNNGDHTFDTPNLVDALEAVQKCFVGYVEIDSPRKHNP